MATERNLPDILTGAKFLYTFLWVDSLGAAVDTTGYAARIQVRTKIGSPDVLADWSTANGKLTITGNRFEVEVPASETALMDFPRGVYDLLTWDASDPEDAYVIAFGSVKVRGTVTSRTP